MDQLLPVPTHSFPSAMSQPLDLPLTDNEVRLRYSAAPFSYQRPAVLNEQFPGIEITSTSSKIHTDGFSRLPDTYEKSLRNRLSCWSADDRENLERNEAMAVKKFIACKIWAIDDAVGACCQETIAKPIFSAYFQREHTGLSQVYLDSVMEQVDLFCMDPGALLGLGTLGETAFEMYFTGGTGRKRKIRSSGRAGDDGDLGSGV